MGDLTLDFSRREFACRCDCGFGLQTGDVNPALVDGLQQMREMLGRPLYCVRPGAQAGSGCRCPAHNLAVGGSVGSQHLLGTAADVWGPAVNAMVRAALLVPQFVAGGVGAYQDRGFIHVDVRGHRARWPADYWAKHGQKNKESES